MKIRFWTMMFLALFIFSTVGISTLQADDVMNDDLSPCKIDCQDDYQDCIDNNADSGDCDDQLAQCQEECDSQ